MANPKRLLRRFVRAARYAGEVAFILFVGATGVFVSQLVASELEEREDSDLDFETLSVARESAVLLQTTLESDADLAQTIADSVASQTQVSGDEFRVLTRVVQTLSGASAVAVVSNTEFEDSADVADGRGRVPNASDVRWIDFGGNQFPFRGVEGVAAQRYVVLFNGVDVTGTTIGTNLRESADLRAALDLTLASGQTVVTPPAPLDRDALLVDSPGLSLTFVSPIVSISDLDMGTTRGWVILELRLQELFDWTLDRVDGSAGFSVELTDVTEGDGRGLLASAITQQPTDVSSSATFQIQDRTFRLDARPDASTAAAYTAPLARPILIGGSIGSVAVAAIVWQLVNSRRRSARAVKRITGRLEADIAEREAIERSLRRREADLEGFTSVAAAKLSQPLGRLARTIANVSLDARHDRNALDESARDCWLMQRLIDDLILQSSLDARRLQLADVDLWELVSSLLAELHDTVPWLEGAIVVDSLPQVSGDRQLLVFVLERLIENAVTFCEPGTDPVVTINGNLAGESWKGEFWRVEVSDRGSGVPEGQHDMIFHPFWTDGTEDSRSANRLSLSIVQRIIRLHGGQVGAEARPGGGTTVWFTLPLEVSLKTSSLRRELEPV